MHRYQRRKTPLLLSALWGLWASWVGHAANQAPVFQPAPKQHVLQPGSTLITSASATIPEGSAPSVSYRLLKAPMGASIQPATGLVTWPTTAANAGTSNLFQVVATANATPSSTATNAFSVLVRPTKPNVVIIVTDDHGYADISAHGCPAPTPNMDRLGREGLRLERFYATPICSVTRSTLLTGRNPVRTQVNNSRGLDLAEHLLPQTFRAAGYQTYMCGKWHLGGLYNTETNTVVQGVSVPVIRENVDYQPQNRGWDVHYGEYTGAIHYTTHVSRENNLPDWWLNGAANTDSGWSTDLLADKAVQLLKQRDPSKPVVLYLAFNAVHGPVSAPAELLAHYSQVPTANRRATLAALEQMDAAIGRVLATLDSEGMTSNTVVTFFGDNGGQASTGGSNLPLRGDKGDLFDGGIHTPAAIRWPGVLPSGITNCQQMVWVGDLFPTLCAAAGITPLNSRPLDGVNLWPLLLSARNGTLPASELRAGPLISGSTSGSAVFELLAPETQPTLFKLIRNRQSGVQGGGMVNSGLFDILNDPYETNDLRNLPALSGVVQTLAARLDAIRPESYSPYIGVHPQSQAVEAGASVSLWALATVYSPGITVQWRKDGIPIPGATNRTLVDTGVHLTRLDIPKSSANDAGVYDVVVGANAVNWPSTVSSTPARLSVSGGSLPPVESFGFDLMLGRPTDTSVAVSLLADAPGSVSYEYGTQPGTYTRATPVQEFVAGAPLVTTLHGLQPNTRHYYRARYSKTGGTLVSAGPEYTFHTQRSRGSTFTFTLEADPHHRDNVPAVWKLALTNMLADKPDFLIDLGDTFMEEKIGITNAYYLTKSGVDELHREVRSGFFSLVGHSIPTFLVNGNHEAELGWLLRLLSVTNNPAVFGASARQQFFPVPIPGGFYGGATAVDPYTQGPRDGYYAFEWGDALFVMLDPFWYTNPKPQQNGWSWTLGAQQYFWLKRTLEQSTARFKFVFAHHLIGGGLGNQSRGGIAHAPYFEWGGLNTNGTYGFATERPGWPAPIQTLLLQNGVQAFFHGHDHLYVQEALDTDADGTPELIYQEVPQPSQTIFGVNSASGYGYTNQTSTLIAGSGHLRVTVSPTNALVEYVRVFLPANEGSGRTNRMISHSYSIAPAHRWSMWKLPDTGQTNRYGTPVPGADADYSIQPPSYTANPNGTVTDNVTGLIWQAVDGGEMSWEHALQYATTNTLGGVPAGTWRLPSIHELSSLQLYHRENPALDTTLFSSGGPVRADYWWSADSLTGDPSHVWCVNAGGGVGPKSVVETLSAGGPFRYHTRLVRGPLPPARAPLHAFIDNGNGTVTDLDTGLMWSQLELPAPIDWTNALNHAENLDLAGFQDWRLPNIKELKSLNDETLARPSIDTRYFPGAKAGRYWSSTSQNNRPTNAWFNEFITGITSQSPKSTVNWVRAVRGPSSLATPTLSLDSQSAPPRMRLRIGGEAGRIYTLQASTNLLQWTDLHTTTPATTPFVWETPGSILPWRFYRVAGER